MSEKKLKISGILSFIKKDTEVEIKPSSEKGYLNLQTKRGFVLAMSNDNQSLVDIATKHGAKLITNGTT